MIRSSKLSEYVHIRYGNKAHSMVVQRRLKIPYLSDWEVYTLEGDRIPIIKWAFIPTELRSAGLTEASITNEIHTFFKYFPKRICLVIYLKYYEKPNTY